MCKLCDAGQPHNHFGSRRNFLKGAAAAGVAAAGLNLFAARPAVADEPPMESGRPRRRYVIRGGSVMSLDPKIGDWAQADVLVEGKKILAVGPNLHAGGAAEIDATGRIVMPGFIDTPTTSSRPCCAAFSPTGCSCQAPRVGTSTTTTTFS
jgi:5-methylthioadenosine/S-adenosylhomocysteine deaminase